MGRTQRAVGRVGALRRQGELEQRLDEIFQQDSSRSPLLFPTIGLFAGAAVGYFVGRSDEPDIMIPGYLIAIPVGAAAGFVIGIIAEDITSQIEAQSGG